MSDDHGAETDVHPRPAPGQPVRGYEIAAVVGILASVVGFLAALTVAFHRQAGSCVGKIRDAGDTGPCYAHPQAALGIALACAAVALGVLVLLAYRVFVVVTADDGWRPTAH